MNITQLQKQIEILTDEINDIFHATQLNFDAIKIQLHIDPQQQNNNDKNTTSAKNTLISQCQKQFQQMKTAYQQRSNLRLQYLINQQIKSQQEKVRRQRLLEYQDKIYDHRRLICDKQSFYDSLIKPKSKRPPGFTNQQFQDYRIKQAQNQQRNNFQQLQEETQMLLKLQKVFRNHRILLQQQLEKYHQMQNKQKQQKQKQTIRQQQSCQKVQNKQQKKQQSIQQSNSKNKQQDKDQKQNQVTITKQQQKQILLKLSDSIPVIYSQYDGSYTAPINLQTFQLGKKLLKDYMGISQDEKQLMKDYQEEREMYRYLKWEKNDLVQKYKKLQQDIKLLREKNKTQTKRKLSR